MTQTIATAVIEYAPGEAQLVAAAREFRSLMIAGIDDRAGLAAVHEARMVLKGFRVEIEKTRKDLKADALEYGRKVDSEAKRLTAIVEPTERALEAQEARIDAEKARIKAEAESVRKSRLDDRVASFAAYGCQVAPSAVEALTDEECEQQIVIAHGEYMERLERERAAAEEKARQATAEAEARRVETERLAAQRADLDRQAAAQRAEREKLDAERKTFDEAQAKVRREQQAEADKAQFQRESEARAKAEAERVEAERVRLEALRPHAERAAAFAATVEALEVPDVPWRPKIESILAFAAAQIRAIVPVPSEVRP